MIVYRLEIDLLYLRKHYTSSGECRRGAKMEEDQ